MYPTILVNKTIPTNNSDPGPGGGGGQGALAFYSVSSDGQARDSVPA